MINKIFTLLQNLKIIKIEKKILERIMCNFYKQILKNNLMNIKSSE